MGRGSVDQIRRAVYCVQWDTDAAGNRHDGSIF